MYYKADIINAQDYYPFGSVMPGRNWANEEYRFGFNGQEKDNEVKGVGNSLDFEARIYDSRLGRWLSLAPLFKAQPSWSTYKAFLNNPCIFVDNNGKIETIQTIVINQKTGETTITVTQSKKLMTDGKDRKIEASGQSNSYHYVNDYYDYTTTVITLIDEKGELVSKTSNSTIDYSGGSKATETIWDLWNGESAGDPYGETKIDWFNTPVDGGIAFYSKDGQGVESKTTREAVDLVDIDLIVTAVTTFISLSGASPTTKLEKFDRFQDELGLMVELIQATETEGQLKTTPNAPVKDTVSKTPQKGKAADSASSIKKEVLDKERPSTKGTEYGKEK